MSEAKIKALKGLLNCFPPSAADREAYLKTMLAVVNDISDEAVRATVIKYAMGEVPEQNMEFAPSPPLFRKACIRHQDEANHKVWLAQNRASISPLSAPVHKRPIREGVRNIIDQYRANYRERLKTEPNLKYTDSIRRDFATATGRELKLQNPTGKADIPWEPLPIAEEAQEYAAFEVLHEGIGYDTYRKMLKRGQLPHPHFYVARSGVVYRGLHPKLAGKQPVVPPPFSEVAP